MFLWGGTCVYPSNGSLLMSGWLHLQGQQMSNCCGKDVLWGKSVIADGIQWDQRQKQLAVTSQVFLGFLGTCAASGPYARKRTSL